MTITNNTLCCHWCGTDLSMASQITYLNGNLPVCQLCLIKAKRREKTSDKNENSFGPMDYGEGL